MKIYESKLIFLTIFACLVVLSVFYFKPKLKTVNQYADIGQEAFMNDNYDKTIRYYKKALNKLKQDKDSNKIDISICLNKIGMSYLYKGKYSKAFKYITEAITIDKKYKNFCNFTLDYISLGTIYFLQDNKNASTSIYYFKKSLNFASIASLKTTHVPFTVILEQLMVS